MWFENLIIEKIIKGGLLHCQFWSVFNRLMIKVIIPVLIIIFWKNNAKHNKFIISRENTWSTRYFELRMQCNEMQIDSYLSHLSAWHNMSLEI